MIMFLRNVLADLEKQNDLEADLVGTPATPAARKLRKHGIHWAIVKRAAARRRASRVSTRRYSVRGSRPRA